MNIIKILLVSILITGFIGVANSQNISQQTNQPSKVNTKTALEKSSVVTYEVKTDAQKVGTELKTKILNKEFVSRVVMISVDPTTQSIILSIDTDKITASEIEKLLTKKDYILLKQENKPIVKPAVEIKPQIPAEKYNPEIDKFLNIEDTSIFNSKFKVFPLESIHPRSQKFYQMIANIHYLDSLLTKIEIDITTLNQLNESLTDDVPVSSVNKITQRIKNIEIDVKADLTQADDLITKINDTDKTIRDFRSKAQFDYYQSLVNDKFNKFGQIIYQDE